MDTIAFIGKYFKFITKIINFYINYKAAYSISQAWLSKRKWGM